MYSFYSGINFGMKIENDIQKYVQFSSWFLFIPNCLDSHLIYICIRLILKITLKLHVIIYMFLRGVRMQIPIFIIKCV